MKSEDLVMIQFFCTLVIINVFIFSSFPAYGKDAFLGQQSPSGSIGTQKSFKGSQGSTGTTSVGAFATPKTPYTQQGAVSLGTGGQRTQGDPKAPVTLMQYSDFTCYWCGRWARETWPKIKTDYVATGKVYFVYKNWPRGPAQPSSGPWNTSRAARCAGEQQKYWPMHDANVDGKRQWTPDQLKAVAKGLGLDPPTFNSCLDGNKHDKSIQNEKIEGSKTGLRGVPHFLLFDTKNPGAQPFRVLPGAFTYATFQQEVDKFLKKQPAKPKKPTKPTKPTKKKGPSKPAGSLIEGITDREVR